MNPIDAFLNKLTMYRVVLYGLLVMVAYSFAASILGQISFSPLELLVLLLTLTFVCYFGNLLLGNVFKAPVNTESSLITALILYFLLWPSTDIQQVLLFALGGLFAMLSKYLLTYKKKLIFNPAAFGAFALFFFNSGGIWWIATPFMLPVTLIVGLLIVRKIRKFTLFFTFLTVTLTAFLVQANFRGLNLADEIYQFFVSFPVIFFGTVMLTEPLTMPPTRKLQMLYASLVGVLFSWQGSFGPIIMTTELVLLIGNAFSFIVSPKYRISLKLKSQSSIAKDTKEFVFKKPAGFTFKPGQYMEWTLPIHKPDGRGNRRYFTIASSPTEDVIRLGIRYNNPSSSFKTHLDNLKQDEHIVAGQLVGDFTLPKKKGERLVFIAGGIGITPFRSMIQYLLATNDEREIVLFYSNKTQEEIAYRELFDEASKKLKIKVVYVLTDTSSLPQNWNGETGRIDEVMLTKYIKQPSGSLYYLSGPNAMVEGYKKLLRRLGVTPTSIVTDYFPGF